MSTRANNGDVIGPDVLESSQDGAVLRPPVSCFGDDTATVLDNSVCPGGRADPGESKLDVCIVDSAIPSCAADGGSVDSPRSGADNCFSPSSLFEFLRSVTTASP